MVEKTQPELLHGLVRWARSRSAYHLSSPPPPPFFPASLSLALPCCLTLPCSLSLLLPLSESSLPHWQALIFSSPPPSFVSLSLSLSFIAHSFFQSSLHTHKPPPPPLPSLSPPSSPQSSSTLAVSSTPRHTLFFNRGGG